MRRPRLPGGPTVVVGATVVVATVLIAATPGRETRADVRGPVIVMSRAARAWQREAQRLEAAPRASAVAGGQVVAVSVEPGPLAILRAPDRIVLRRTRSGQLRGSARVLVADARGAGGGFVLRASVAGARPPATRSEHFTIRVPRVVVTAADTEGVRAAPPQAIAGTS